MNEQQAKARIKELKGFYRHLASYTVVNFALFIMSMADGGQLWFIYPLCGWGIGLGMHAFKTFAAGKDWEERKLQELTGWSTTQEELEQLRERTEVLISVLSSVDWERIDPALLSSRENLENARQTIERLQAAGASSTREEDKQEVMRELEKLEAFVTGSKFDFYDKAQGV
jgi:hypothetical protein